MHVCFITHEYPKPGRNQGGIGSVVQTIGRALVKRGIDVSVVGVGGGIEKEEHSIDEGVEVHRLPVSGWPFGRFIPNAYSLHRKLKEIHRENPIDILEGSELSFAFIPESFPAKKVIRMHGGHHFFAITLGKKPAPWRSFQERRSFAKADALIAVSNFVGTKTKELLGFEKPFSTIYNIVDTGKFYKANHSKIIPKKLLFVGTVTEKKGVRQLVQAMPEILKAFPEAILDIIGRDWHDPLTGGSYSDYLRTFITDDIKHAVNLVGPLPHEEIPSRLEAAEVCVYPSHMEAMPIAWLEGLGMGKAVVASKLGPGPEAVVDHQTGLLCDPLNPSDIAEKVIYMLKNPEDAFQMGKNARKDVLSRFDTRKIIEQNMDFYKALL
jgi:glycosyltransferase involved in cell wall biosynthesis